MDFRNKVVVVTGGAQGIGKCICDEFEKAGATVCVIDVQDNRYFKGDLADKPTLESFADKVIREYGRVDYLINNAAPLSAGIDSATYEDFEYALRWGPRSLLSCEAVQAILRTAPASTSLHPGTA